MAGLLTLLRNINNVGTLKYAKKTSAQKQHCKKIWRLPIDALIGTFGCAVL